MHLIERLLTVVAPHECLICYEEGDLLCSACAALLPAIPSRCYRCQRLTADFRTCTSCRRSKGLFSVQPVTAYDGAAKEIIRRLKYERAAAAADTLAREMAARMTLKPGVIITHVPTATSRVRRRGFDQAALIARHLASRSNHQYSPLLARLGQERQVGKNRLQRQQREQIFVPTKQYQIQKTEIVLVDDVITTGSTLEMAASALKAAGARRIYAAVFAAA
jgi:ComF family protein